MFVTKKHFWLSGVWMILERTVNVSNESVYPTSGFEGDSVTYKATVLDSAGEPLPSSFMVDLVMDSIVLVNDKYLTPDVYNPSNGLLTLQFNVPNVPKASYAIKLVWLEQTI